MPLPSSKEELLDKLQLAYEKLDAEFDDVTPVLEKDKQIEGNISCCDVIAYQLGWGQLLLGWDSTELSGSTPDMPASGFKWNQLGELANSFYQAHNEKSLKQLRTEFKQLYNQLTEWIESLTEAELLKPHQRHWTGGKWAMVKWIQINTIAPYQSARTKVRRWKREQNV